VGTSTQDTSGKKKVSRDVGDLIKSLYEKDEEYAADDSDVRSVTNFENYVSDSDSRSHNEAVMGQIQYPQHCTCLITVLITVLRVREVASDDERRGNYSAACSLGCVCC
jgi:hypothetical protein